MKSVFDHMKENNAEYRIDMFRMKQKLPYEAKKIYAWRRAYEFQNQTISMGLNTHVSVGGLDSIVEYVWLKSIGIKVPAISVSFLEDRSIQRIHKQLGIERIGSAMREDGTRWKKPQIIREFGFPILSKEIAGKIALLQNPTPENATVRHAIMTGETGEYGGFQTDSRMKLADKWLKLFGGPENEKYGTSYKTAPFKVSDRCCYYLKEKPCDDWARDHNSVPYLGLMASEGGRRQKSLMRNGCNYYGKSTIRSAPFAIFTRQDLLRLALEMDEWAKAEGLLDQWGLETIVPGIYGEIKDDATGCDQAAILYGRRGADGGNGCLYTTRAQRTGCSMCGFGIHMEKRPHRFDRLYEDNPKEWKFWMYDVGWGEVLDYVGVEWRQDSHSSGQMMFFVTAPPVK